MSKFMKIKDFFREIDVNIGGIVLIVIFLDVILQVLTRILPGNSISWTVELGELLLLFVIWFGLSSGVLKKSHIKLDIITIYIPKKWAKIIYIFSDIIFIIYLIILSIMTIKLLEYFKDTETITVLLKWPLYLVRMPILIGCVAGVVRLLIRLYRTITNEDETVICKEKN